jgi:hypothetical protein
MDTLTNALMAPFSTEKAALSTPAKTAAVYGVAGILVGIFVLGNK